jgi:hypothetical protein
MSSQSSTFTACPYDLADLADLADPIATIKREEALAAMDERLFAQASDRPDETRLNAALEGLRLAHLATRAANKAFADQMVAIGYRLESTGSYEDEERYFVHHTVQGWDDGLWGDTKGLVARRLVVKF